ncbi:MAG: helix-turn-helix domain-containing protein [Cytophagales bacterium]|mgnify:CR=1 FL=1|uniref:GlxA family transcriptional regulator n=1 Tax=Cyclobacterium marinum TaxID=104 RepID=UPI0011EEA904|nr:helix-turn-helix domain-containing protein [Cyclobacterium marinum]MBI0398313.1 helix-turn-helix domain-containing protein [Cyclobacterium marinum]MBR9777199.1 helix-turn-helix domain-containing protein [Cytophagales bacterium]|tara:strand:- start:209107 stop:210084 length:978 start_codon:yes stop_codon:yes gene_type:complete
MKHVSILIPRGHTSMVNISGSHQMLNWVNEFFIQSGRKPLFTIQLVGLEKQTKQTHGLFIVNPEILIDQVSKTDLIIIPAIHGDFNQNLKINSPFLPWIIDQHNHGAEVVSLCVASFFLAETGLLDGRQCSTHWQFANEFRKRYPKATLKDDKIMTEADGIYTSGGAYSFTNLILYLIEKFAGRDTAVAAAKGFMIDIDRNSQSPFMVFSGQKSHQDKEILKAQEHIEKHFNEKLVVNELCKELAISRRTFERRFKKATGNTVVEYHQRVKVEAAKRALETGRKHINEVMYDVGYNDPKAFRDVFRKITDMTPLNYMTKYSKQAI